MTQEQKKWYDNQVLIIVLLFLFFPVGLYALWKSNTITKQWKIIGTAIIAIGVIIVGLSDDKSSLSEKSTVQQTEEDSIPKTDNAKQEIQNIEVAKDQQQLDFVKMKSDLYQEKYANAANEAQISSFQIENKKVTKAFFNKSGNKIINWVFKVENITLSDKPSDKKLLMQGMTPNQVRQKDPTGRNIDFQFTAFYEGQQYMITVSPAKGTTVNSSNPLYKKLMNLKTESYVFVSGSVVDLNDYTTQVENGIILGIKLTDISEKLD